MEPWRVLIVEDDVPMRDFFAASVQGSARLALAGALGSVAEACAWLERGGAPPADVLLVDLGLPDGSGLEVIRHARLHQPQCEPLVISMFGDEDNVLASVEAGALGYIHKDATPENIAHTILEMKAGASPISPMIARRVLSKYLALWSKGSRKAPQDVFNALGLEEKADQTEERSLLSRREQEVLELIARGFSYADIARLQAVSMHTVQTRVKKLYAKLAVHSKNEAVFEATRLGLLPGGGT